MASSSLAEAFARLPTSDSRLNALEALIKELTPYEWRFVQSLTNWRSFQFDIIGHLPVELVSHIFSYLDTSTPWRLQHVSRSWYQKLRSLAVLKPSLDSWYDGTVDFHGADLDFCWHKARSIHAFRSPSQTALPDSAMKISAECSSTEHLLRGDYLIWLANDRRQVHVLNLRTLTTKTIVPMARELIRSVAASDDLVTVATHAGALIYIGELAGHGPVKRFRFVRSSRCSAITCRRRTVACATPRQDGLLIYIWDYDTQQGRSITITRDTPIRAGNQSHFPDAVSRTDLLNGIGLLLQPDTETLVLCLFVRFQEQVDSHSERPRLLYHRFTFSGECLQGAEKLLEVSWSDEILSSWTAMKFTPASRSGLFMLHCNALERGDTIETLCTLQFDEHMFALTSLQHPILYPLDKRERSHVVWWKDTFFEGGTGNRIVLHTGTISHPYDGSVLAYDYVEAKDRARRDQQTIWKELLLNDSYIVRPYDDAFYIYCYDHTVHLPGKEGILDGVGPWKVIEPNFAGMSNSITAMEGM